MAASVSIIHGLLKSKVPFYRALKRRTLPIVCVQRSTDLQSVRASTSATDPRFSEKYCLDLVRSVLTASMLT